MFFSEKWTFFILSRMTTHSLFKCRVGVTCWWVPLLRSVCLWSFDMRHRCFIAQLPLYQMYIYSSVDCCMMLFESFVTFPFVLQIRKIRKSSVHCHTMDQVQRVTEYQWVVPQRRSRLKLNSSSNMQLRQPQLCLVLTHTSAITRPSIYRMLVS